MHEFHATQLELDCSVCHVPVEANSTVMQRPGHDQCLLCHEDDYEADLTPPQGHSITLRSLNWIAASVTCPWKQTPL